MILYSVEVINYMMFEEILRAVAEELGLEFEDLCFSVSTDNFDFLFSFFAFETDDVLGLFVTDEEGREKINIIVKSEIVYIRIHYEDELQLVVGDNDEEHQVHRSYI